MSDKDYITRTDLREELGNFAEEILLPAMGTMIDDKIESKLEEKLESKLEVKLNEKFDEKLAPIWEKLISIEKDLEEIKSDLKSFKKATNDDLFANNEVD